MASITRAAGCLALATPGQWWRQHAATLQCDVAPFSRSVRRMGRWHTTTKEWTLWSHCCCSCPGPSQAIQASYGPNSGDWAFARFYEGSILAAGGRCVNGCKCLPTLSFRDFQVCADDVASVIGDILLRCREDGTSPVRLCKPKQTGEVASLGIVIVQHDIQYLSYGAHGHSDIVCADLLLSNQANTVLLLIWT